MIGVRFAAIAYVALAGAGCAFGTGVGAGVVRSTEPADVRGGEDVSASLASYYLDGYLTVKPMELIAGMGIGSVRTRTRTADSDTPATTNHSGVNTFLYGGAGYPLGDYRGARIMPYAIYGKELFGSDILPSDVTSELEVGAEIGIFHLWGLSKIARHGFAVRVAYLQVDGNVIDPVMLDAIGTYTGRGVLFVVSWRTSRWRFSL